MDGNPPGNGQSSGGVALPEIAERVSAAAIDFIILGAIGFMLTTPTFGGEMLGFFGLTAKVPSLISSVAAVVVMLIVSGAYFIGMWLRMGGATVGMKVLKLSVRDSTSGGPITQGQAINRWLLIGAPYALEFFYGWGIGIIISLVVLVFYIYLLVTIAQSKTRQGLHDTYSKTVVAKG